jgi:uncharacterized surface protein with fasciclin (FAS1) repeats
MSDEDATPPDESAAGAPPPPPPPPGESPTERLPPLAPPGEPATEPDLPATEPDLPATEPIPTEPLISPRDEAAAPLIVPLDVPSPPGDPVADPAGGMVDPESTAVMSATPGGPLDDEGLPPIPPMAAPLDDELPAENDKPWYQRPGPLIGLLVAILAAVGLLIWLFGGDDDTVAPTASRLVLETVDETGRDIDRGFIIEVRGPAGAQNAFEWITPAGTAPGDAAIAGTGTTGAVTFEWQPDATVADPANWGATVTLLERVPPGWTPPGPSVQCSRQRNDAPDATVQMDVVVDGADAAVERIASYTFPNFQFRPGDAVTCRLVSIAPVETTTTTTTTEPETTTTTEPETTTTTAPPETTTTTSIDIAPPLPEQTLWDVIEAEDELSEFRDFVEAAGFREALETADGTFTIFAPTNDAIAAAREAGRLPGDEDQLRDLLLAHANIEAVIEQQQLLLLPSFPVAFGGPQPVTAAPPTIGGAAILFQVPPASNGVLYLISEVLTPVPE